VGDRRWDCAQQGVVNPVEGTQASNSAYDAIAMGDDEGKSDAITITRSGMIWVISSLLVALAAAGGYIVGGAVTRAQTSTPQSRSVSVPTLPPFPDRWNCALPGPSFANPTYCQEWQGYTPMPSPSP